MSKPVLWIVIPCYNEEQVLPITAPMFLEKIHSLTAQGLVSDKSRVLFVNDGSRDKTWELIQGFAAQDEHYIGISQSRNRGHQNAVLAGLMEALHSDSCDITISIDCDGQDDINAMDEMVKKYLDGAEVVYGVRSRRDTDTFFKRFTAEGFYHVMNALGADIVFNHADYRLISTRVLESFADYKEVNIFLRGMVPLVGFAHDVVTYERHERLAGESHYPLSKMLALAFDGITSLSNKPIRIITGAGIVVSLVSFIGVIWAIVCAAMGSSVAGWASTVCIVCFMGGVQLVCLGVIGEYIGKIYMETKGPPALYHLGAHMGSLRKEISRMSKQSWKGSTLLNPEPPVLVSCGGLDKPNLITIGWTGTICTQPSMVSISVRPERYSHQLLCERGQFAINLPTEKLVRAIDWCGVKSGRDVDKFAACGLHAAPGSVLTDCPVLEESPVNLECRITQRIPLGSHDLFLAEVVACDVDESLLDEKGKLCLDKANLIVYSHGEYLALGKKLGTFGYSVRKKKPAKHKK